MAKRKRLSDLDKWHACSDDLTKIVPRQRINIRLASERDAIDLKAIDALHKKHIDGLGYWQTGRIEGYIKSRQMLIAETIPDCVPNGRPMPGIRGMMLGFLAWTDKYKSREDVACIYGVCVEKHAQRSLVGAALVQQCFERMPYGVRLCCCWCAQDLDANHFWENLGFVPLAFRTGSEKKSRVHIFWQRRIRDGDEGPGATPYWYPSLTNGGVVREGRLVLPMLPGMEWFDEKPMVLPQIDGVKMFEALPGETQEDAAARAEAKRKKDAYKDEAKRLREAMKLTPEQEAKVRNGQVWTTTPEQDEARRKFFELQKKRKDAAASQKKESKARRNYSETYLAAARAMCAMYLEQLEQCGANMLPGRGKYEATRSLESALQASGLPALPGGVDVGGGGWQARKVLQLPGAVEEVREAA